MINRGHIYTGGRYRLSFTQASKLGAADGMSSSLRDRSVSARLILQSLLFQ